MTLRVLKFPENIAAIAGSRCLSFPVAFRQRRIGPILDQRFFLQKLLALQLSRSMMEVWISPVIRREGNI
jgi:hypothetical protein